MRHHLTPVRMGIIKNLQTVGAGEGVDSGGGPLALLVEM